MVASDGEAGAFYALQLLWQVKTISMLSTPTESECTNYGLELANKLWF